MGWGPLAWERRPRPEAQTPWHAQRSCQDAGDSRPPVAPAQPLQLRGICCSEQMQLGDFLCLCWLRAGGPGFSPGGAGVGLAPLPVRLHRGAQPHPPAQTQGPQARGSRSEEESLSSGVVPAGRVHCLLGPNSKHGPPPSSTAPSPHQLLTVPVLGQAWPSQLSCPLPLLPPLPAGLGPQGASGPGPVSTLPPAGG